MSASLFDRIIQVLTPDLGLTMARSSVRMFLKKENITVDDLDYKDLPVLANRLKPGLTVFVGNAKAEHLIAKVIGLKKEESA